MLKYDYFLFDLDRTLWDFDKNAKNAISRLITIHSLPLPTIFNGTVINPENRDDIFYSQYERINYQLWDQYEAGKITKETLRSRRFYDTFLLFGIDDRKMAAIFDMEYLDIMADGTELVPGAIEVLDSIKSEGGKIAIITNGFTEVQHRKLENSGLSPFVDLLITSEEVGIHKPSPGIFRIALERLTGLTDLKSIKQRTLMIGDDFTHDIEGAQIFGIDQFFYNPKNIPCEGGPTYMSDDLRSILKTSR